MKYQPCFRVSLSIALGLCGMGSSFGQSTPTHTSTRAGAHASASHQRLPLPGEFNVLTIVLDDVGTDQLQMYANDFGEPAYCDVAQQTAARTPYLDELRADGVLFSRCYAAPSCSPTRAALLTGRYGRRTGIGLMINAAATTNVQLRPAEVTLPDLLMALNPSYARGAFGKWHLSYFPGNECNPIAAGFDVFKGMEANPDSHYSWKYVEATGSGSCGTVTSGPWPITPGLAASEAAWTAGKTRVDALEWMTLQGNSPFFAYVAFSPPHAPWQVPPFETLSAGTRARLAYHGYVAGQSARTQRGVLQIDDQRLIYHAMLEGVDYEIRRLVEGLSPAVRAKTMVFVIGDNGTVTDMIADPELKLHGKRTTYALGTRVPLIVSGPLVLPQAQGGTCREFVGAVDMWRTLANTTGLTNAAIDAFMAGSDVDSLSFMTQIQYPALEGARAIAYCEGFSNGAYPSPLTNLQQAATDGQYRLIRKYSPMGVLTELLFDELADPCELLPLELNSLSPPEMDAYNNLGAVIDSP